MDTIVRKYCSDKSDQVGLLEATMIPTDVHIGDVLEVVHEYNSQRDPHCCRASFIARVGYIEKVEYAIRLIAFEKPSGGTYMFVEDGKWISAHTFPRPSVISVSKIEK